MNISKDEMMNKTFNKSHQLNFFKNNFPIDNQPQKIIPKFSISHYTFKNKRNKRLNKTSNMFYSNNSINNSVKNDQFSKLTSDEKLLKIKIIKMQKSLSEIFKNNDVDFVRNLNVDSFSQFNDYQKLKYNINNINNDYFEKEKHKKFNRIIFGKIFKIKRDFERLNKRKETLRLSRKTINISHDIIQVKKKELKVILDDNEEKKMMNNFKILKKKEENLISKKKGFFSRIKDINEEIKEIKKENQFIVDNYTKDLKNKYSHSYDGVDLLDEIIEYKTKNNFYKKNNNKKIQKSFLQELNIRRKNQSYDSKDLDSEDNKNKKNNKKKNHISPGLLNFYIEMKKSIDKDKYNFFRKMQNKKINELLEEKDDIDNQIIDLEMSHEELKKEMKEISDKLMMSYKESLHKGTNVRNEGLAWLIKSIWTLGENVPMSFMPDFLDCESIDFLFKLARKQYSIQEILEQISDLKIRIKNKIKNKHLHLQTPSINEIRINEIISYNKTLSVKEKLVLKNEYESKMLKNESMKDVYKDLVNQFKKNKTKIKISNWSEFQMINKLNDEMEKIKKEIDDLKQKEINRIYLCFLEQNYENKFHTNIEIVLSALIGFEGKEAEMNKFKSVKKNYIANMQQIRFFAHNYTKKIYVV